MTHPDAALVVSAARMMSWIETVCAQGIRRPGSAAHVHGAVIPKIVAYSSRSRIVPASSAIVAAGR